MARQSTNIVKPDHCVYTILLVSVPGTGDEGASFLRSRIGTFSALSLEIAEDNEKDQ